MLDHLGEKEAAAHLVQAIEATTASGLKSVDVGGAAKTDEVTKAILQQLKKQKATAE